MHDNDIAIVLTPTTTIAQLVANRRVNNAYKFLPQVALQALRVHPHKVGLFTDVCELALLVGGTGALLPI